MVTMMIKIVSMLVLCQKGSVMNIAFFSFFKHLLLNINVHFKSINITKYIEAYDLGVVALLLIS